MSAGLAVQERRGAAFRVRRKATGRAAKAPRGLAGNSKALAVAVGWWAAAAARLDQPGPHLVVTGPLGKALREARVQEEGAPRGVRDGTERKHRRFQRPECEGKMWIAS